MSDGERFCPHSCSVAELECYHHIILEECFTFELRGAIMVINNY